MEIGKVLFQKDVEGIPKPGKVLFQKDVEGIPKPTFQRAVEVKLPNPGLDDIAKWAVAEYNKQGTLLVFESTIAGWVEDLAICGKLYHVLFYANDGSKTNIYYAVVHKIVGTKTLLLFHYIGPKPNNICQKPNNIVG